MQLRAAPLLFAAPVLLLLGWSPVGAELVRRQRAIPNQINQYGDIVGAQVHQTGTPLLGGPSLFSTSLAGNLCVPATGAGLIDNIVDLPGPGSVSVTGTVSVCLLTGVCRTLCNPCTLGPLCNTLCRSCVLCP